MTTKKPMMRRLITITKPGRSMLTAAILPMRSMKRRMSMCGRLL